MLQVSVLVDYTDSVRSIADWSALAGIARVEFFRDHLDAIDAIAARLAPFDIVVAERERTRFPRALLERLPRLKLLVATGPVNWSIDLAAAAERGMTVCCTEALYDATPELAWGLILTLTRRIAWDHQAVRAGQWQTGLGTSLTGKTLGVIGLGNVGAKIAAFGRVFGMSPIAWSRNLTPEKAAGNAGNSVEFAALDDLLRRADIVTIHVVLSPESRGLIGRRELGLMKRSAFLINTSRGPIVDAAALLDALETRRIAGAALDVFDVEPLPVDHRLRRLDNVVLTPHVGYITVEQYRLFYGQAIENILAFTRGTPIRLLRMP